MSTAWAVVAAALGSSFLTIVGTFWLERWRAKRADHGTSSDRLREACIHMCSHAMALALRGNALYLTAIFRSGIGEGLDVALYHRRPLDVMELTSWLFEDLRPMLEAQSLIEITGDHDLIRATADLVLAGMAVVGKASDVARSRSQEPDVGASRRVAGWMRGIVPMRKNAEVEQAIQQAVRTLGQEARQFARVTRERLGVNDPDAVIRAFPELFSPVESKPETET
jgi:hypothetical protein